MASKIATRLHVGVFLEAAAPWIWLVNGLWLMGYAILGMRGGWFGDVRMAVFLGGFWNLKLAVDTWVEAEWPTKEKR